MSDEQILTAPSTATDGRSGGPGVEGTVSSPPPAGPPDAVSFGRQYPLVELTLKVRVDINMPLPEGLAEALSDVLQYWSDGRKHFHTELIEEGFAVSVRKAVEQSAMRKHHTVYGNETVTMEGGKWKKSRASIETERETENLRSRIYGSLKCVESVLSVDDSEWD